MNNDINAVILTGRLAQDPMLREAKNGKILVTFNIAVNRYRGKDKGHDVSYIDCAAFGTTATFIGNNFRKADEIIISKGYIDSKTVAMKDAAFGKAKVTKVIIEEVNFGPRTKASRTANDTELEPPVEESSDYIVPNDDLPF